MPEPLQSYQIEAAIQAVDERWAATDHHLLPAERDEWEDVLVYVLEGELKPAIDGWETTKRPSAAAVLDYIVTNRTRVVAEPKEPPAPELGGKVTPVVAESIAEARAVIQRRLEARSCAPSSR